MKYIAIIDIGSSAQMYVDDIIDMGYQPLLIYNYTDPATVSPGWLANMNSVRKGIGDKAEYLDMDRKDTVDTLVSKLKGKEIVALLPGTDSGVRLADQLCSRLDLRGNDPATTDSRLTKMGMDLALAEAGVRHIMTSEVKTEDDVRRFWNDNHLSKAVLKFSEGSGTVGLKICSNLDDCVRYLHEIRRMPNMFGALDMPVLMQEYIGGTEYIVNSVSLDGVHKITDVWRYEKIVQEDGVLVYDTMCLMDRLPPGVSDLVAYDYAVLDAVGMRNGFCHTEIKVDDKGPVLIETNPRPMGACLSREYLDEVFGSHMTDVVLKSYLMPGYFSSLTGDFFAPRKSALIKFAIVPREVEADLGPFLEMVRHLESYRDLLFSGGAGMARYPRTIDLETSPFFVKMINGDYGALRRDYELLRLIEDRYFGMVFSSGDHLPASDIRTDLDVITRHMDLARRYLVVTDSGSYVTQYGERTTPTTFDVFDGVILSVHKESSMTDRVRLMISSMGQVRKGGYIVFTPESYSSFPYGAVTAEGLMNIMGFNLAISPSNGRGILYGFKR